MAHSYGSNYGHDPWWDRDLVGGDNFQRVIEERLGKADAVVVLWTETSMRKPWVLAEAAMGLERDCLIGVRYDPDLMPPKAFAHIQAEYLGSWNGKPRAPEIGKLVERINELKHARDSQRLTDSVAPMLRAVAHETNIFSTVFGVALPGGLPIHEYALGSVFTALGIWAMVAVVRQLSDGEVAEMPGLEWAYLAAAGIAMARAVDQYISVSRKECSIRFYDRSFVRSLATSSLLAIIVVAGMYLVTGTWSGDVALPLISEVTEYVVRLFLTFLLIGYMIRLFILFFQSVARRV